MAESMKTHWDMVYAQKTDDQLSWHQDDPAVSLALIEKVDATSASSVIDVGGGASRLVDCLLAKRFRDLTVLDLSQVALGNARNRLGKTADDVVWLSQDVTSWMPARSYDIWHDRAVFHFLVDQSDREKYVDHMVSALPIGGHSIIATFAPDGPSRCSGMPVVRYSPDELADHLADNFEPISHHSHMHYTPWGMGQSFQFSLFRRIR